MKRRGLRTKHSAPEPVRQPSVVVHVKGVGHAALCVMDMEDQGMELDQMSAVAGQGTMGIQVVLLFRRSIVQQVEDVASALGPKTLVEGSHDAMTYQEGPTAPQHIFPDVTQADAHKLSEDCWCGPTVVGAPKRPYITVRHRDGLLFAGQGGSVGTEYRDPPRNAVGDEGRKGGRTSDTE